MKDPRTTLDQADAWMLLGAAMAQTGDRAGAVSAADAGVRLFSSALGAGHPTTQGAMAARDRWR